MERHRFKFFLLAAPLFVLLRVIYLDADLALAEILHYSAIDEFFYTIGGFNLFHYGSFLNSGIPFTERDAGPFNIFHDLFTSLTLAVFKNTYYGLRMAPVICSILIAFLTLKIAHKGAEDETSKNARLIKYAGLSAILLLLSFDFSFLSASRVSEPGIFRCFAIVVITWLFSLKEDIINKRPFLFSLLMGFVAMSSVCFVYLYNAFIVAGAGLALFLIHLNGAIKIKVQVVIGFVAGLLISVIIYEVFIRLNFNQGFIDYLNLLNSYSDSRIKDGSGNILKTITQTYFKNISTNVFKLNLGFLFLVLISLPLFIYRVLTQKKNIDIFIICLILFWGIQSLFENSYYEKRHVIMYPVFLLVCWSAFKTWPAFTSSVTRGKIILGGFYFLFTTISSFLIAKAFYFNFFNSGFQFFFYLNAGCLIAVSITFILCFLSKISWQKGYILIFLAVLIPGIYLSGKTLFINPTFHYKNAMIDIGKQTNGKVLAGGLSFGFRLYNTSTPVLNAYAWRYHQPLEYKKRIKLLFGGPADFMILYSNSGEMKVSNILKELAYEQKFTFAPVETYNLGHENITLYKKIIN